MLASLLLEAGLAAYCALVHMKALRVPYNFGRRAVQQRPALLRSGLSLGGSALGRRLPKTAVRVFPLTQLVRVVILAVTNDDWSRKVRLLLDPVPRHAGNI